VCEAGDLFSAFNGFAEKMATLQKMTENVEKMEADGAPAEARSKAYDDIEQEFHRDSAFADYDSELEEEMRRTLDFNDQVVHSGNKEVEMNLFYMCAKNDPHSYTPGAKCGLFTAGKLWNRRGAAPEKTRTWYCGLESTDWSELIQRTFLVEAGAPNNDQTIDLETALTRAPHNVGCGCKFSPYKAGASMVLEVTDRSQPGVLSQYAIRASIPPGPLSTEIQKVQRGWYRAGKRRLRRSCTTQSLSSTRSCTSSLASPSPPSAASQFCWPKAKHGPRLTRKRGI
jgi:hypothetical protein